jgi:hypothetical protein
MEIVVTKSRERERESTFSGFKFVNSPAGERKLLCNFAAEFLFYKESEVNN